MIKAKGLKLKLTFLLLILLSAATSCSTTRVLAEGEYRLVSNTIEVTNDRSFETSELQSYIQQKPKGWSPFMAVYNWSGSTINGFLDKFFRKIGVPPTVFNPDAVSQSVSNIEKHLEYIGCYDSQVQSRVENKGKIANVYYSITLGKQYPISKISYSVPEEIAADFYSDTLNVTIKAGDYLSEEALEKESVRSAAALRNKGYYGINKNYYFFSADTLSVPGTAVLNISIKGYTRNSPENVKTQYFDKYRFAEVSINFPQSLKLREKTLKDLNTIRPGELYSEDIVNNTYSRLTSLRVLNSVNIELDRRDSALVDCSINLSPSKPQGFKFNIEASTNSNGLLGFSPELSFYHKNIFKGGEMLNLGFMGNFQFKPGTEIKSTEFGISAGISLPKLLFADSRRFKNEIPRSDFSASYNFQDRPEYKRNIISTSIGLSGQHKNSYYQLYPLQLNIVRLFNLDPQFYESLKNNPFMRNAYQNHFDLGFGGLLNFTTDPSANPQSSYRYTRLQFGSAGNLLQLLGFLMKKDADGRHIIWNTPFSQYIRGEVSLGRTWCFGKADRQAIAARLFAGLGLAYGNSDALPFEQHFYSGGASSLRGWQARSVGPGKAAMDSSFVIPNQTGDLKLEANLEYRFPLFWKFDGALFVDAGNVWTVNEDSNKDNPGHFSFDNFARSIAADWGMGLRLDLSFILVRVDMGMKVHDPSRSQPWLRPTQWLRSDGFAVHFGVGYPF